VKPQALTDEVSLQSLDNGEDDVDKKDQKTMKHVLKDWRSLIGVLGNTLHRGAKGGIGDSTS